ncbi:hypothetical protein ZWY2020_046316 [Hordeum vulgare]|nr:hypothetical protein ZWY2020_046316 [Hordeum vulgare]
MSTSRRIHGGDTPARHRSHGDIIIAKPSGAPRSHTTNWVASTDGMTAWIFVALPEPRLINILTGAVTRLPPLPDETRMSMEDFRGIVDGNGTLFLYSFQTRFSLLWHEAAFTAAILCPGDATWKVMKKTMNLPAQPYATYHDGKVIVWAGDSILCFRMTAPDLEADGGDISGSIEATWNIKDDMNYSRHCSYILVSQGELLWASVLVKWTWSRHGYGDPARALRVIVHAMQKESSGSGKMRWVRKEGRSLGDRVMFLGSPASFAMKLDGGNGCAYFVFGRGVFRYNFVVGEAKFIKGLRSGCYTEKNCVWLRPSLSFTPIQEITKRLEARNKMSNT